MQLNPWIELHCVQHSNVIEYKYFNPRIKFDLVFFFIASGYNWLMNLEFGYIWEILFNCHSREINLY